MIYLSQLLGNPVLDANGERIGVVNDLGIATREVFPRVTSLAFQGPGKTPFMISWRKYVETFDENEVRLAVPATDIRFSYLQPDEVLIARDLLNKQIVDTRGMRVVRVNDLKLSDTSSSQLRLLGAEVGVRGILRALSPAFERLVMRAARAMGHEIPEKIIAWNYMDLIDRDLSNVKLSVSHQTLDDLHPADVADIIEQLDPRLRGQVFAQLDDAQAAEAMAELDDDEMAAKIMGDMADADASRMLSEMDPDDAAELVGELDYERAEKLLRLMGINEQRAIRQLLGYKDDTAGRIMTSEFVSVPRETTVAEVADRMRGLPDDFEPVNYIYLTDADERLCGVVPVRRLFISDADEPLSKLANEDDILTAKPDDDQEDVAQDIAKYNLLAMPVVDEKNGKVLGIVTVDDALDVMEEEHEEDLRIAGGTANSSDSETNSGDLMRFLRNEMWFFFWMVAAVVLAVALGPDTGVAVAFAAPVALVAAVEMVRFVTNFFLEYDEDDEDAPSVAGFAVKSVGMGVLWAAIVMLVCAAANGVVNGATEGLGAVVFQLLRGFEASALAVVVTFVLAPVYLVLLRRRDEQGNDTSGLALQTVALVLAAVVFVGVALALATPVLG
ncbi:magnesium transporter MgtE N-terminal domain-containing protein [uncultured Parolsenella sp.]|uniref:magnesium transporter n=1 Tax=uncultured Parolsenella sp. TaxID=2083008 RepID=UPI0027DBD270|nr:CBS domain-containing protein [uncultured Parolsenella sp.]